MWIFVNISIYNFDFVLGIVYIKPDYDFQQILGMFQASLDEIFCNFTEKPLIIMGDFNARMSNQFDLEDSVVIGSNFYPLRKSLDEVYNARGMLLNEFMYGNGFVLLNGRTRGDIDGLFTFCGHQGNNAIDLAWVHISSIELVNEYVSYPAVSSSVAEQKKLKWVPENREIFKAALSERLQSGSVDIFNAQQLANYNDRYVY